MPTGPEKRGQWGKYGSLSWTVSEGPWLRRVPAPGRRGLRVRKAASLGSFGTSCGWFSSCGSFLAALRVVHISCDYFLVDFNFLESNFQFSGCVILY